MSSETQEQVVGVQVLATGQWTWICDCGAAGTQPMSQREEAREDFLTHRRAAHGGAAVAESEAAPIPEAPAAEAPAAEAPAVAKPKKGAAKKAATKKPAATAALPDKPGTKKPAAKKPAKKNGQATQRLWALTFLPSPTTGREIIVGTTQGGMLLPKSSRHRFGMQQAAKWGLIMAASRTNAARGLRGGRGEWFTPVSYATHLKQQKAEKKGATK